MNKYLRSLALIGLCVLLLACSRDDDIEKPAKKMVVPLTEEDAEQFRRVIDKAIADRDQKKFIRLVSKPDMFRKIFMGIDVSVTLQREIESAINRAGNVAAVANRIFSGLAKKGSYEFVRIETNREKVSLLYRFLQPNSKNIRYHRYELVRTASSKVLAADIYFYVEDESLVSLLRQQALRVVETTGKLKPGLRIQWPDPVEMFPVTTDEFKKLSEYMVKKEWEKSWAAINEFPGNIRHSKMVQIRRLLVAEKLGEEKFDEALGNLRKLFPKNLFKEYLAIDFYRQKKANKKIVEAVDLLLLRVQDPYLQHFKLDALIKLGKLKLARKVIDEFKSNHWLPGAMCVHEFELSVAEKNFGRSVELLLELDQEHGLRLENLSNLPRYADLVKSRKYKQWKSSSED